MVGSNNTGELQARLEAIFFLLSQNTIPPHIMFCMDSTYVLDLLSGRAVPSQNLKLCALLLDYFHHLTSITKVSLEKVKAHTGDPGNERADKNAAKGVHSRTNSGRFAQTIVKIVNLYTKKPREAQGSTKSVGYKQGSRKIIPVDQRNNGKRYAGFAPSTNHALKQ